MFEFRRPSSSDRATSSERGRGANPKRRVAFSLARFAELLEERTLLSATMGPEQFPARVPLIGDSLQGASITPQLAQSGPLIHIDQFRADPIFAGIDGTGFSTVIIDTGIDLNHPFFGPDSDNNGVADRIVYSYDFSDNDDPDATDFDGHGSNVASIVASSDGTYTGMAPGANIIALKVFPDDPSSGASIVDIVQALDWVVAHVDQYNIASVNLSLGGGFYTTAQTGGYLASEFAALVAKDVFVVSASGNDYYGNNSQQGVSYPAADVNSLSIGAVYDGNVGGFSYASGAIAYSTGPDRITPFSERSSTLTTVFAPGAPITGAGPTGGLLTEHGTSQASPHIAGIGALAQQLAVRDLGRRLTQAEFASLLKSTGATINDGDDEDDNVTNTGLDFKRVDVYELGKAIHAMAPTAGDSPGVYRNGKFYLDANLNGAWNNIPGGDLLKTYGAVGDIPVAGDWDGDGVTNIGVFRNGIFYLDYNGNGKWDNTAGGDKLLKFGTATDIPVVGDWNKDGKSDIGVFRNGRWYLDQNGDGVWKAADDATFTFGIAGDTPVTGDFTGDGKSQVGVFRQGKWYLDLNGDHKWNGVAAGDSLSAFGNPTDIPVTGDWDNSGKDKIGVFRSGTFYLDMNGNRKWNGTVGGDYLTKFGAAGDLPVTGLWTDPANLTSDSLLASQSAATASSQQAPVTATAQQVALTLSTATVSSASGTVADVPVSSTAAPLTESGLAWISASQQTQGRSFIYNPSGYLTDPSTADAETIARSYLSTQFAQLGVTSADVSGLILTGRTTGYQGQGANLYFQQSYNGLPVEGSTVNVSTDSQGRIVSVGNRLIVNLAARIAGVGSYMTPLGAITATAQALSAGVLSGVSYQATTNYPSSVTSFSGGNLSRDAIPLRLVYQPTADGLVHLAWNSVVRMTTGSDWFYTNVDAVSGEELYQNNWTHSEDFAAEGTSSGGNGSSSGTSSGSVAGSSASLSSSFATGTSTSNAGTGTYRVYNYNLEDPNDGTRTLIAQPEDATASPYGWHDTNASSGPEFTDTRGNNVFAQEDADDNDTGGFRPDGGASLTFDFALDLTQSPTSGTNQSAAITNLFYLNNILHDLHYQYGFDESSGNFQINNYGKGGLGGDQVFADAQDGSGTDNANFATPPDGFNPRMQMYLFDLTNPQRDGDLSNNIIIHEFGHGVSNRLTGGPADANALDALQSGGMGEGWSDFWALMFNQKPTDQQNDAYPTGTWVLGQSVNGPGIRRYPYSYNMAIDPLTYDDFNGGFPNNEVHNAGEIWCTTLWDMNWLLINRYGYSSDLYDGTAGNNMAMELVMEGLKLQPANPSFLDARDAILAADVKLNGGANQDLIWQAFARRGMGVNAYDGGSADSEVVIADFEIPVFADYRNLLNEGLGTFRDGKFFLDANLNKAFNGTGGGDYVQVFGNPTDIPVVGDWDGNGLDQVGVFRNGTFYLDYNGNGKWDNVGGGDKFFKFGNATDTPVVGDWNKDGKTDIGVFRNGKFYLDLNGDGKWGSGDTSFNFGIEGDVPVSGDFNGDGRSEVGVFRQGRWYLDLNNSHTWDGPAKGDASPLFGNPTDKPVTGDWNNTGRDKIGVFRAGTFYLDGNGDRHWSGTNGDIISKFGGPSDLPVIGRWIDPQTLPPKSFAATSTLLVTSAGSDASATPQVPLASALEQGAYIGFASAVTNTGATNSVTAEPSKSSTATASAASSQPRNVVPLPDEGLHGQLAEVFANLLSV